MHATITTKCKLINNAESYYKYTRNAILENDMHKLYWDLILIKHQSIRFNYMTLQYQTYIIRCSTSKCNLL